MVDIWHPPPPFVSADSKGLMLRNCVSVDSGGLEVFCFECSLRDLVSADSKGVKVVCFDTDSLGFVSVDSAGVVGAVLGSADSVLWAGHKSMLGHVITRKWRY